MCRIATRLLLLLALFALAACSPAPSTSPKPDPSADEQAEKAKNAHMDAEALAGHVQVYFVNHDEYPPNLEALLAPPNGGKPYVLADKLNDPWGKMYQLQIGVDGAGNQRVEVFTIAPDGQHISNLAPAKKK